MELLVGHLIAVLDRICAGNRPHKTLTVVEDKPTPGDAKGLWKEWPEIPLPR